jgi:hypothetical protein
MSNGYNYFLSFENSFIYNFIEGINEKKKLPPENLRRKKSQ